jgi:thiamine biosynthesis lipoprotein ApbE
VLPSATETDALSTALLATGSVELCNFAKRRPEVRALVIEQTDGVPTAVAHRL